MLPPEPALQCVLRCNMAGNLGWGTVSLAMLPPEPALQCVLRCNMADILYLCRPMAAKLIIFDYDGTLGDTQGYIVSTMHSTMQELGLEFRGAQACAASIGLPLKGCFRQLYPDFDDARLEACMATYRRIFQEKRSLMHVELFPGVKETILKLWHEGRTLSVASSRSSRSLKEFLAEAGILDCFSLIIGADNVTNAKPDPEPVLITLETLGVTADDAWVVGDMPVDILMGLRAGCRTCGVSYGNSNREDLLSAGASAVIDRFADLPRILL